MALSITYSFYLQYCYMLLYNMRCCEIGRRLLTSDTLQAPTNIPLSPLTLPPLTLPPLPLPISQPHQRRRRCLHLLFRVSFLFFKSHLFPVTFSFEKPPTNDVVDFTGEYVIFFAFIIEKAVPPHWLAYK